MLITEIQNISFFKGKSIAKLCKCLRLPILVFLLAFSGTSLKASTQYTLTISGTGNSQRLFFDSSVCSVVQNASTTYYGGIKTGWKFHATQPTESPFNPSVMADPASNATNFAITPSICSSGLLMTNELGSPLPSSLNGDSTIYMWTAVNVGGNLVYTDVGYIEFVYNNGTSTPVNPDYSSHIETFTYSTSTAIATVTGYWNATSTSLHDRLAFYQTSNLFGQESAAQVNATTSGPFSFSFPFKPTYTTSTSTGTTTANPSLIVTLHAKLYAVNESQFCFGCSSTSSYQTLIEATSTSPFSTDPYAVDLSDPRGAFEYPEYECSLSSITGCFKNAGIFLFYPSQKSVDQFSSLNEEVKVRTPFVYVYQAKDIVLGAFSNTTPTASTTIAISLQSDPFNTNVATSVVLLSKDMVQNMPLTSTIRLVLSAMLWIGLFTSIYYQGLYIHRKKQ